MRWRPTREGIQARQAVLGIAGDGEFRNKLIWRGATRNIEVVCVASDLDVVAQASEFARAAASFGTRLNSEASARLRASSVIC